MDRIRLISIIPVRILIVVGQGKYIARLFFFHNIGIAVAVFVILWQVGKCNDPVRNLAAVIARIVCFQNKDSVFCSAILLHNLIRTHCAVLVNLIKFKADVRFGHSLVPALFDPVFGGSLQGIGKGGSRRRGIQYRSHHKALINIPYRACSVHGLLVHGQNIGIRLSRAGICLCSLSRDLGCPDFRSCRADGNRYHRSICLGFRHTGFLPPVDQLMTMGVISIHGYRFRLRGGESIEAIHRHRLERKDLIAVRLIRMLGIQCQSHRNVFQPILIVSRFPVFSNCLRNDL